MFAYPDEKEYKELNKKDKASVKEAIRLFQGNQFDPKIRNHPLQGKLAGHRSIDAGFDLRIVCKEQGNYTYVLFLQVGSHSQLYG